MWTDLRARVDHELHQLLDLLAVARVRESGRGEVEGLVQLREREREEREEREKRERGEREEGEETGERGERDR